MPGLVRASRLTESTEAGMSPGPMTSSGAVMLPKPGTTSPDGVLISAKATTTGAGGLVVGTDDVVAIVLVVETVVVAVVNVVVDVDDDEVEYDACLEAAGRNVTRMVRSDPATPPASLSEYAVACGKKKRKKK